jgi:hypothetical protein
MDLKSVHGNTFGPGFSDDLTSKLCNFGFLTVGFQLIPNFSIVLYLI